MSQRNGDRARADQQRRSRIHDRARIRALRKTLGPLAPKATNAANKDKGDSTS